MTTGDAAIAEWKLEIVRGKEPGKTYALRPGAVVLGNAPGDPSAIDLADQEADAPRRMAARQARLEPSNGSIAIRDLDSPGGTFVNRQRLPPGTALPLREGDLIQLGPVQLRVVRGSTPSAAPPPAAGPSKTSTAAPRPFAFTLKTGAVCRSWDDFLAVSAQRWADLRDEMTSGRLAGFLAGIGRADLAPDPAAPGSPDERLDAWIGALPTTRPARPELDVHPRSVVVRASAGGGSTRRKIQVNNAGYRLLRTTARVEPPTASWLRIVPAGHARERVTIDSSEMAIEIDLPEAIAAPRSATLVIEGNGGEARVAVSVEPPTPNDPEPAADASSRPSIALRDRIAVQSTTARLISWSLAAIALRVVLGIGDRVLPSPGEAPGLLGPAALLGASGAAIGLAYALRRGEARDLPAAGFAGGIVGGMVAAVLVAVGRVVDPIAGHSLLGSTLAWGALAAALAGLSTLVVPPLARSEPVP